MSKVTPKDLAGAYKEIAEIIGVENTVLLHEKLGGRQLSLPKKLYSLDYIIMTVKEEYDGKNMRTLTKQFNYTERRLRQFLKKEITD